MGWSAGCVIRSYGKLRGRFNMLLSSRINGNQLPRQIGSTLPIYPLRISNPPNGRICQCPFWSKVWVLFSSAFLLYLTIAYLKPPIFLQSLHHRAQWPIRWNFGFDLKPTHLGIADVFSFKIWRGLLGAGGHLELICYLAWSPPSNYNLFAVNFDTWISELKHVLTEIQAWREKSHQNLKNTLNTTEINREVTWNSSQMFNILWKTIQLNYLICRSISKTSVRG